MESEKEMLEKTHIEALIKEWKFQCAEGIETYPKDRMFEICYEDAYKRGKKDFKEEVKDLVKSLYLCLNDFSEEERQPYTQYLFKAEQFLKE